MDYTPSLETDSPESCLKIAEAVISPDLIQDLLTRHHCHEQRQRDLPAMLVFWLCIAMSWFTNRSIPSVLCRLIQVSSLFGDPNAIHLPSPSAISQARYRLGAKPFEQAFKTLCQPLVTTDNAYAFRFGLRLVCLDGTTETVADTPANDAYFGRSYNQYRADAYPSCRIAYLCEAGTHAIFDAAIAPRNCAETTLAWRLLRSIRPNMLVMFDAGLTSFDFISRISCVESHVLAPANTSSKHKPCQFLDDGTYLSWMYPTNKSRCTSASPVLVRVIDYWIQDPASPHHRTCKRLITTLLDPLVYPAIDLIELYHERWEIELTIDEIDTHQRYPNRPFRSKKPLGVLQEFYAMLLAHYVVRVLIFQTAQVYHLDPDRLSFTFTLQVMTDWIGYFQLFPIDYHPHLFACLFAWIRQYRYPERRLRFNPRVVKRRLSKFLRKQPHHLNPPKPTCSFRLSISLS
ncbi:MAG: IS4 family transposase [Anaerolineae bacterium]|nr:IS4 family transposase [Anaerolineae bacterium]